MITQKEHERALIVERAIATRDTLGSILLLIKRNPKISIEILTLEINECIKMDGANNE